MGCVSWPCLFVKNNWFLVSYRRQLQILPRPWISLTPVTPPHTNLQAVFFFFPVPISGKSNNANPSRFNLNPQILTWITYANTSSGYQNYTLKHLIKELVKTNINHYNYLKRRVKKISYLMSLVKVFCINMHIFIPSYKEQNIYKW